MGVYRLETFETPQKEHEKLAALRSELLENARNEAYAKGFKDGVNVTNAAIETERNKLLGVIREAASDLMITHDEASNAITRSMAPLVSSVIRALAPHLARTGFQQLLIDQVQTACASANGAEVLVEVPETAAELLTPDLFGADAKLRVVPRKDFAESQARICWAGGNDRIDLDATAQEIMRSLDLFETSLTHAEEESAKNVG